MATEPAPWGEKQQLVQKHIIFGDKFPAFLGFDRPAFALPGGRATVHQGQIYRSGGRVTSFAPSVRIVTDMSRDDALTCLCGGPSERRSSRYYVSDMKRWRSGQYKRLVSS